MAKCHFNTWTSFVLVVMCSAGNIMTTAAQPTLLDLMPANTNSSFKPLITVLLDAVNNIPLEEDLGIYTRERQEASTRSPKSLECIHKNTSDTQSGLQRVSRHQKFATTFFMRPRASFKKLELRMKLGDALEMNEDFYSEKRIDIWSSDIGALEEWKQVSVEYYKHQVRGFNRHALRVTFGVKNISMVSDYNWLFHDYEGFTIYAEGGAEFTFNCPPVLHLRSQSPRSAGVWLMVGLLTVASLLLAVLLAVWFSLQRKKRRPVCKTAVYPIYDEFDEEVLKTIQKKVEALRDSKGSDVCVVTYENQDHKQGDHFYPYPATNTEKKQEVTEEHVYECPYALIEAQKQRNENPYAVIDPQKKKEKHGMKKNIYEGQKNPEENIYEDPYAFVQYSQEEDQEETGRKKTDDHYQSIFPTKPIIRR